MDNNYRSNYDSYDGKLIDCFMYIKQYCIFSKYIKSHN